MPTPTLVVGAPCWIDLYSSGTDKAKEFYGGVFGWTAEAQPAEFGGYFIWQKDGKAVGGCMANSGEEGHPDSWTVYLTTDDVERTAKDAAASGGQVNLEPMQVAENGWFTIIGDPAHGHIGAWQPGKVSGFEVWNEPGTPRWFELDTPEYARAVDFYRDVFKWDTHTFSDTDEFRYTTLRSGDQDLAGIQDGSKYLPEGTPAVWTIYFGVDDTDAALEQIVELGGSVVEQAQDTPYGRLAKATDPTGTPFKLMASAS
jgi:predicted enzyme related to lactoylglutathione lyase